MIPRLAFFVWVGDKPLPWLRQLSIDTFRKQNPDWDVELLRTDKHPDNNVLPVHQSDLFRYEQLVKKGGFYFDTDIVFFRPFPEHLRDADLAVTIDKSAFQFDATVSVADPAIEGMPGFTNLACLGCTPGSDFFEEVSRAAIRRIKSTCNNKELLKQYQLLGTNLLNRMHYGYEIEDIRAGYKLANIPLDLVLPIRWWDIHKLFNGTAFEPLEETIGVHWYGGAPAAKRYASCMTEDNYQSQPCYLTKAIDMALA